MLVMGDNDLAADRGQVRTIFENIPPPPKKKRRNFVITIPAAFFQYKPTPDIFGLGEGVFLEFQARGWIVCRMVCALSEQCLKLRDSFTLSL